MMPLFRGILVGEMKRVLLTVEERELSRRIRDEPELHRETIARFQRGDESAERVLVSGNRGLVRSLAKKYKHVGVPFEDRLQAGFEGLLDGLRRFDVSRDNVPISFLWHWVRVRVRESIIVGGAVVRFPEWLFSRQGEALARRRLSTRYVYTFSDMRPLFAGEEHEAEFEETLTDDEPLAEELLAGHEVEEFYPEMVKRLTSSLKERDLAILVAVVVDRRTLVEAGESMDLSRERIRQILLITAERCRREAGRIGADPKESRTFEVWAVRLAKALIEEKLRVQEETRLKKRAEMFAMVDAASLRLKQRRRAAS